MGSVPAEERPDVPQARLECLREPRQIGTAWHQARGHRRGRVLVLASLILFLVGPRPDHSGLADGAVPGLRRDPRGRETGYAEMHARPQRSTCSSESVALHDVSPMVPSGGAPSPPIPDWRPRSNASSARCRAPVETQARGSLSSWASGREAPGRPTSIRWNRAPRACRTY